MTRLICLRFAWGGATLLIVSFAIFASVSLLPGDAASALLGQFATPEAMAAIRESLGLDKSMIVRYLNWLARVLQGDFGTSAASGLRISDLIGFRLWNTLYLAAIVAAVAVPLSVLLGIVAAIRRDGFVDRAINSLGLVGIAIPEFFIAYVLILLLAVKLHWLPSIALLSPGTGGLAALQAIALPALTLVLAILAHMMRMTRAALIDVFSRPYIEMAKLKGLPNWRRVIEHALPNALAPILTIIGFNLAYLVVGVIVIETIFVYPGIGQLMVDAVSKRDVSLVQACGLIFAATYIIINMLTDVFSIMADPRQRYPR